jgi:CheY-like chemotaxis protein
MHILVVDDDAPSRFLLDSLLVARGHKVSMATDGADALKIARANPPDLVISDILMPEMDGYRLCIEWHRDPRLSGIQFIFYSATYVEAVDETFALSLGADVFLRKPMHAHELIHAIEHAKRTGSARDTKPAPRSGDDPGMLREYNERLVSKLEKKVAELQATNATLQSALELLSDEVGVKDTLITRLTAELERYSK